MSTTAFLCIAAQYVLLPSVYIVEHFADSSRSHCNILHTAFFHIFLHNLCNIPNHHRHMHSSLNRSYLSTSSVGSGISDRNDSLYGRSGLGGVRHLPSPLSPTSTRSSVALPPLTLPSPHFRYAGSMGGPHSVRSVKACLDYQLIANRRLLFAGLVTTMFAAAGTLLNVSKRAQNQGKACRLSLQ